jgi:outer membrane autotransporter protein
MYGRLLAKHDSFKLRMSNGELFDTRPEGHANGLGGELGYRFGSSVLFDVSSGLSHVRTSVEEFEAGAIDFDPGSLKSTRGTLAARATLDQSLSPFAEVKLSHEFEGDSRLTLGSGGVGDDLEARGSGTWARFEAGIGGQGPGPVISAWGELGDVKGWGLRAGFRF